jgi:hypothetical protein
MPEIVEFDEFAPVKAVKAQVKLKLGIDGPSGSGKTDGALALATLFGSAADASKKPRILVVDTENRSSALYADRYDFDIIPLKAPYTPERYKRAMQRAVDGAYDWLVVDTISHEWDAEGGILRKKDRLDLAPGSNSYTNWAKLTPDHEAFIEFIKQIPVHTICTMRSKQAYVLETNDKGRQVPRKIGMAPVQRDGVEYEFTLIFDLDMAHRGVPSKNRTTLFADDPVDLRDPHVAQQLRAWLESGTPEVQKEWAPQLGTVRLNTQGETVVSRAPDSRPPYQAQPPLLINSNQKGAFWAALRAAGKTDDQVRQWLFQRFKIATSAEIPSENFKEAMQWASEPVVPVERSEAEVKARDAAKHLGVQESDLQYELQQCDGDWGRVYEALNVRADAEEAALEKMNQMAEPAQPAATTRGRARRAG